MAISSFNLKASVLIVIAAVLFSLLASEYTKAVVQYEIVSLALMPVFQLGWKSGVFAKIARRSFDDSPHKYPLVFFSQEYFDNVILKFKAKPDHVYVVTFPKSGTHLTGQLVTQIVSEGKAEFETLHEYVAGLEFPTPRSGPDRCEEEILGLDNIDQFKLAPRKVILTHMAHVHVPYSPDAKYIVMMRNPLDVMLSAYNMFSKKLGPRLVFDWDSLYEILFADDEMGYARYNSHWWRLSKKMDNVRFIFYEDALNNMTRTIVEVTEFLGMEVNVEIVEKVRHLVSIEYMKPNSAKFEPPSCIIGQLMLPKDPRAKYDMVNKGKVGRGKKAVPEHIKQKLKTNFHAAFKDTDFPVERYASSLE